MPIRARYRRCERVLSLGASLLLAAACAHQTGPAHEASAARQFIEDANVRLDDLTVRSARAEWVMTCEVTYAARFTRILPGVT